MELKITLTKTIKGWRAQTNTGKVVIQTGETIRGALANLHYAYIGAPDNNVAKSKKWANAIKVGEMKGNTMTVNAEV